MEELILTLQLVLFYRMKWLRSDGGPMFYGYSNRTPVTGDVQMITTCLVFGTIFTAFLIIFPGVRKEVSNSYSYGCMHTLIIYKEVIKH